MALHIQMSEEALQQLRRQAFTNRLVSFGVCAGLLLLFGGILYFTILMIQGEVPAEFIAYQPPAEDGPPTPNPVQRELSSRSAASSPTVTPSVIVAANATSAVAAPVSFDTTGDLQIGEFDLSLGMGAGLGDGLGSGGQGLGSGTPGGSSLEGTFYDLKLTRGGAPSTIPNIVKKDKNGKTYMKNGKPFPALVISKGSWVGWPGSGGNGSLPEGNLPGRENEVCKVLYDFLTNKWNTSVLSKYYSPSTKLYASSIYVPFVSASYAPEAYNCSDTCQDAAWICVYKGRVRAPKTGKFRFIGTGDDYIGVRFNNEVVLEAGYRIPSLFKPDNPGDHSWWVSGAGDRDKHWAKIRAGQLKGFEGYELIQVKGCNTWNNQLGGLTAGKTFSVKEGQSYPIQIAISEIPGGGFGAVLLIEDVTNGKSPAGATYDIFRTNLDLPTKSTFFSVVEKANYETWKNAIEQDIKDGKKDASARPAPDVYDKFKEKVEELNQQIIDKAKPESTPFPKMPWSNTFFHGRRPASAEMVDGPGFNEDSPVWTAVP